MKNEIFFYKQPGLKNYVECIWLVDQMQGELLNFLVTQPTASHKLKILSSLQKFHTRKIAFTIIFFPKWVIHLVGYMVA